MKQELRWIDDQGVSHMSKDSALRANESAIAKEERRLTLQSVIDVLGGRAGSGMFLESLEYLLRRGFKIIPPEPKVQDKHWRDIFK